MELKEKLQELRRREGLTQEELANALYVSRAAISKWESGRGYPSIDSLKAVAEYFSVTLDELLSDDAFSEVSRKGAARERDDACDGDAACRRGAARERSGVCETGCKRSFLFGLPDCAMTLLAVVPVFGRRQGDFVQSVSLASLFSSSFSVAAIYAALIVAAVLVGLFTVIAGMSLPMLESSRWFKICRFVSVLLGCACVLAFVAGRQPYAAAIAFAFLVVKAFLLFKRS